MIRLDTAVSDEDGLSTSERDGGVRGAIDVGGCRPDDARFLRGFKRARNERTSCTDRIDFTVADYAQRIAAIEVAWCAAKMQWSGQQTSFSLADFEFVAPSNLWSQLRGSQSSYA